MGEQKIEQPGQQPTGQPPVPPGDKKPQEPPVPVPPVQEPKKEGQPPAPEDFALSFPQGVEIDKKMVEDFKAVAKAQGLNGKAAQAVVDFYLKVQADAAKAYGEASAKALKDHEQKNTDALKSDPDFGKDFDTNRAIAQRPLEKYGDPATAKYLADRGLANDPVLVKFLHKIGSAMGEDQTHRPAPGGNIPDEEKQLSERYNKSPELFPGGRPSGS